MKKVLALVLAIALMASLAACSTSSSTPGTVTTSAATTAAASDGATTAAKAAHTGNYKIGFCLESMKVAVWNTMSNGMAAKAKDLGDVDYDCQVANDDAQTQISNIENMIAQSYNAIIIHSFDREAFADVTQQALDAGVVICAYDDDIVNAATGKPLDYQLTFLCDNYEIGYRVGTMAAEWTKANFQGDDKLQFGLMWHAEFEYQQARCKGIRDAIAKLDPRIEIVEEHEGLVTEDGVEAAETWMQTYPNMVGIVATNDTCLLGYSEAWKAAGKDLKDSKFGMFGNDGVAAAVKMVSQGTILRGDVALDVYNGGADALDGCYKVLQGEKAEDVVMPMVNVTVDTASDWMSDPNLYTDPDAS